MSISSPPANYRMDFQLKWTDNRTLIVEYQGWDEFTEDDGQMTAFLSWCQDHLPRATAAAPSWIAATVST